MDNNVVQPDNTLLLMQILGDIENRTYIELVRDVQGEVQDGINNPPLCTKCLYATNGC